MKQTYAFVAAKMIAVCLSVDDDDGGEKKYDYYRPKLAESLHICVSICNKNTR
jgi:hypothetical protein